MKVPAEEAEVEEPVQAKERLQAGERVQAEETEEKMPLLARETRCTACTIV